MIRIQAGCREGRFFLECGGHAGYRPGNDIVCAAVSALCQSLGLWCRNTAGVTVYTDREASGRFCLEAGGPCREAWRLALLGLLGIQRGYPDHVCIQLSGDLFPQTDKEEL